MSQLLKYVKQYFRDTKALFASKGARHKLRILLTYNSLVAKNLLLTKILRVKLHKQKVLGYTVYFDSFNSFFGMFTEIFLHNVYLTNYKGIVKGKSPLIADCGANIGLATIFFKYKYPDARIHSFEPDPQTFKLLEKNVKENNLKNVTLHNFALGEKRGKIKFYSFPVFEGGPGNTVLKEFVNFKHAKEYLVDVHPLSSLRLGKIDILKVDVEGAEVGIFRDLARSKMLSDMKIINLEYHYRENNKDNKLSELMTYLEEFKWRYIINPDTLMDYKVTLEECTELKMYVLIITAIK